MTAIEVGLGPVDFTQIPPGGAAAELITGIQGGWHIDVAARLWGQPGQGLVLRYELRDPALDTMPGRPAAYRLAPDRLVPAGDHLVHFGRVVFAIDQPAEVVGRTLSLSAAVSPSGQSDGMPGPRDERTVHIVDAE